MAKVKFKLEIEFLGKTIAEIDTSLEMDVPEDMSPEDVRVSEPFVEKLDRELICWVWDLEVVDESANMAPGN